MGNVLLEDVEYRIEETKLGVWRRYVYESGASFHEFVSHNSWGNLPLVHITRGKCPETGKRICARGVIAIGCFARGVIAIGALSAGLMAVGAVSAGLVVFAWISLAVVFGFGQVATGIVAVGQMAIAAYFALGQFAVGYIAIGQVAFGKYVLAQMGFGEYVFSMARKDPEAIEFFESFPVIGRFIRG